MTIHRRILVGLNDILVVTLQFAECDARVSFNPD